MSWKTYALVSGAGGLLATYLASVPVTSPTPAAPLPVGSSERISEVTSDLEVEAKRLQSRLGREAESREPSRNPFRFGAAEATRRPAARRGASPAEASLAAAASAAPAPPPVRLFGLATDVVDGQVARTAILATVRGVELVKEGEPVSDGYRVRSIDDNAVELESTADGTILRLTLGP
jgi:hypothetical protein